MKYYITLLLIVLSSCAHWKHIDFKSLNPAKIKINAVDNLIKNEESFYFIKKQFIDIQVMKPAAIQFPMHVDRIYVVEPDTNDYIHSVSVKDTLTRKKIFFSFMYAFDSVMVSTYAKSLILYKAEVNFINRNDSAAFSKDIKYNDVVISITNVFLTDTIKPLSYGEPYYYYRGIYDLHYRMHINIANGTGRKIGHTQVLSDTLYWRSSSVNTVPPPEEAFAISGTIAAKDISRKLSPYWINESRTLFFNRNRYMKQGYKFYLDNKLAEAIDSWKYLYEKGTPQLASVAAHNIALMYELLDDVNTSETWLKNSLKMKFHGETIGYLSIITKRISEKSSLDNQIKNNN